MDLELRCKVAVVTGASKGIGLAVTRALAAEGAEVVAGARTIDSLLDIDGVSALEVDIAQPGGPSGSSGTQPSATGAWTSWSTTSAGMPSSSPTGS